MSSSRRRRTRSSSAGCCCGRRQRAIRSLAHVRAQIQLSNSAAAELYTDGQIPAENLFGCWGPIMGPAGFANAGAKLPALWPQPIYVRKGGALSMLITDQAATASHFRVTFWGCLLYGQSEREAA